MSISKENLDKTRERIISAIDVMKKKNGVHPVNTLADTLGLHFSKLTTELEKTDVWKIHEVYEQLGVLAAAISLLQDTEVTGIKDYD